MNGDGSLSADGFQPGLLIVKFADNTGQFEVDSDASIGAFSFNPPVVGGQPGTFVINGGTTTINSGTFWNKNSIFDGTLKVTNNNEGSNPTKLEDKGQTQLVLVGNNTTIQVEPYGTFQVDGGAGKTLISESVPGSNDYINVNGGELVYQGKAGVTDTFTVPVSVGSSGNFSLDGGGGGTLAINGSEQGTNNVSLYSSGNINLSNLINLKLGAGMNATSVSHVASLDSQTETITVASGSPCIIDGTLQIDTNSGTYGQFVFNCDTLNFGGTLEVALSGPNNGVCDQLVVNGILDLDPSSSILDASLNGSGSYPESWIVINSSGGIENQFAYIDPINSVYYMGYNYPSYGEFTLYYGY